MSNGATALLPATTLDDDAWGDLLRVIEERRLALLREAAGLVEGLPPAMREVHDVGVWRDRIRQAQQGAG